MPQAAERAAIAGRDCWGPVWKPEIASRAPGRLELLGNHIDYNGGPVLAAAIDRDVVCLLSSSDQPGICVRFPDIDASCSMLAVDDLYDWKNRDGSLVPLDYVRGVIAVALDRRVSIRRNAMLSVAGDVPIGFGLSSSAALCIALTQALVDPAPEGRDLVLFAQEAEHRAGTPCGTMDQSASVGGNVILFNGANVSWRSITPEMHGLNFAVANSGVSRSLASSSYGTRVNESQRGLAEANQLLNRNVANLAELSRIDLDRIEAAQSIDSTVVRRIRHIVTETERVGEGIDTVTAGDWVRFGQLMSASGRSSAVDYEISHPAVEALVTLAESVPGVLGARMMGGGEGGTALILLQTSAVEQLRTFLDASYFARRNMNPDSSLQVLNFSPGASFRSLA